MTKKERQIIDLIYDELKEHRHESAARHKDIDVRMRKVEATQSRFKGALGVVGFMGMGGLAALIKGMLE